MGIVHLVSKSEVIFDVALHDEPFQAALVGASIGTNAVVNRSVVSAKRFVAKHSSVALFANKGWRSVVVAVGGGSGDGGGCGGRRRRCWDVPGNVVSLFHRWWWWP